MAGVEILASNEVVIDTSFNIMSAAGAFGIIFGFFIIAGVVASLLFADWNQLGVGVGLGIVFSVVAFIAVGCGNGIPTAYETQYKVTISDEVSMNDFLERYEIIEQEGKIYTVRERNEESE